MGVQRAIAIGAAAILLALIAASSVAMQVGIWQRAGEDSEGLSRTGRRLARFEFLAEAYPALYNLLNGGDPSVSDADASGEESLGERLLEPVADLYEEARRTVVGALFDEDCTDVAPDGEFSCSDLLKLGYCSADFMIESNLCASTCGRDGCSSNGGRADGGESQAQVLPPAAPSQVPAAPAATDGDCVPVPEFLKQRPDLSIFSRFYEGAAKDPFIARLLVDPEFEGTVFAPTDSAFMALNNELGMHLEDPMQLPQPHRGQILEMHIVPGLPRRQDRLLDGVEVPTLYARSDIHIRANGGNVLVESPSGGTSRVIEFNGDACAAVVHVVDSVLLHEPVADLKRDLAH